MVTFSSPGRAVPSRLAMRIASTTPWQYPRGVIRTTSMESSLRGAFRRTVEAERSAAVWTASGEKQPRIQENPNRRAHCELCRVWEPGRRHECLERPRDDQQAGCPKRQQDSPHRNSCQRLATTQLSGTEDGVTEHEPGPAADDDDAELEHAVGNDQRPELDVVAAEADRGGDGTEHPTVGEQHKRSRDAEKHAACKADERNPDVVLNDERRRERGVLHARADLAARHLVEE